MFLEKKIALRATATRKGHCSYDEECDDWHLLHCQYLEMKTCQMRKDSPHVQLQEQGRSTSSRPKEKGKDKGCEKERKTIFCYCEYCISETRLQVVDIYASTKSIPKVAQKSSSGRIGVRFSRQSLERATFRERCPSLTVARTHHHVMQDQQSEMRSEKSVQDTQRTSSTQSYSK